MNGQAQGAEHIDITPLVKAYMEGLESWRKPCETLLADDGQAPEGAEAGPAASGFEAGMTAWRTAGGDAFKGFVEPSVRDAAELLVEYRISGLPVVDENIAVRMEKNAIKRIPIVDAGGELVGIVSRANLVQAVATAPKIPDTPHSDTEIRKALLAKFKEQPWVHTESLTLTVSEGVVNLWGIANSELERKAIRVAAEETPGVLGINDYMAPRPYGTEA